ncbi:MAG: MATE family efflux transporter [Phycisphaerales bacterium]|jgi:multidrug resistance protein, MATE family|nr:MATE family efflux transporter [Phycisphaerales bacterium]
MDVLHPNKPVGGFAEVLRMAWPASIAMLGTTVIKFVDGFMVSKVGAAPFSAQFLAGMSAFVPEALILGLLTVINTYVSQNVGAGRYKRAGQYAWAGMAVAFGSAVIISMLWFFSDAIFGLIGNEEHALESMYFKYMIVVVLVTLPTRVMEQFFFGVHRPRIVLLASVVANLLNIGLNYVLIFGKFGAPAMGLEGAAIGSVIAWVIQFLILLAIFLSPEMHRKFATRMIKAVRWRQCKDILRVGWPAGVQLCNDMLSWSVGVAVLAGSFGAAHRAATTIAMRYIGLAFMPAVGIGIATTALVGRYIGLGEPNIARKRAHQGVIAAMIWMGFCGTMFWIFRYPMSRLFVTAEHAAQVDEIIRLASPIMISAAIFQLSDAVGIVYIGALRGSGDTKWPMSICIMLSWTIIIGGGSASVKLLPQLTSLGPWIAASVYVIVMGVAMAWRFESGAWRNIDLLRRRRTEPSETRD